MKYKTNNKSIMALVIAVVFILAQLLLCTPVFTQKINASASKSSELKEYTETVTVSNGDFSSTSGSTYPRTPSNWEAITSASPEDSLKAGVININNDTFEKNKTDYGLTLNPEAPSHTDDYILMLNSQDTKVNYGYKSSSITLDAQSYYSISFSALTQTTNNNGFSAYITSDSIENTALNSFVNVQSGVWNTYSFYITTGLDSVTINIELWIGTKTQNQSTSGAVFFDNVKAVKYTETAFDDLPKDALTERTIDLQSQLVNKITNASFENGATGFTKITTNTTDNAISGFTSLSASGFDTAGTKITTAPSTNMLNARDENLTQVTNQKGLFINNLSETATGYKTASFVVDRFETYAISIWVKTSALSANGVSLILTQVEDEDSEETLYSSTFSSLNTSSYTNSFTNNWAQYTFYVQGNPFESTELELQLWLGTDGAETQGYAFFDEIRVSTITPNQYANATEGTYLKKLSLSNLEAMDIANGAFNLITNGDKVEGVYEPSDWTLSSESGLDSKYSGIINTKSEYFDATSKNYNLFINPGVIPNEYNSLDVSKVSNNILMIYNATAGDQTYTSSEYSLSADTTYKVTFYAKVGDATDYATVKIANDGNTIANFIITNKEWTKYTAYIKNGASSETVTFALSLGSADQEATGYAFFDNFESTTVEDDIYELTANSTTALCDLAEENFLITGEQVNEVYTPYQWTGKNYSNEDDSIIAGILNKNNTRLPFDINDENSKTGNSLVIFSPNDTYYSFTSTKSYTFSASSYYKVDITFKTYNISQDEHNKQLDTDDKEIPFGAFFELSGLNVKSNALVNTNDEFTTYTFYIKTSSTETSSTITVSLGGANALTKGGIAVSKIAVNESTEDAYNEVSNDLDSAIGSKVDLSDEDTDDTTDDTTDSTPNFQLIDIAGIIIVVAIVIAVIGTIIKKVTSKKKNVKTTVGKYDRTYSSKNAKGVEKVEDRLQEVEVELARLNEVISVLTKTQNELIEKRANCSDTMQAEKLLKQIEKISNELSYELDNKESVLKEQKILKSMLEKDNK